MKTWQPWTMTDGTLQLTEWPDHGPGVVVVEGDVFAAWDGLVLAENGFPAWRAAGQPDEYQAFPGRTDWMFYGEGYRPLTHADILADLFAHIDAHPQTHYVLRTLHPERVRERWPFPKCRFCDNMAGCHGTYENSTGFACDECCGHGCEDGHCERVDTGNRPNVTLSLGPLATQAEADRLVPRADLDRLEALASVEFFMVPSERIRIDFWTEYGLECGYCREWRGVEDECERVDEADGSDWWFRCPLCGEQTAHTPTDETLSPRTRITVTGGEQPLHPDNVRCLRDQAVEAGVAFAFLGWGEWVPKSHVTWEPVCPAGVEWGTLSPRGNWFPMTTPWNGREESGGEAVMVRVGSENSGSTLDGRTWPWVPTESGVADG